MPTAPPTEASEALRRELDPPGASGTSARDLRCGACREIEPEALARLVGWVSDPQGARAADALLEVREERCRGGSSCEAQAARAMSIETIGSIAEMTFGTPPPASAGAASSPIV